MERKKRIKKPESDACYYACLEIISNIKRLFLLTAPIDFNKSGMQVLSQKSVIFSSFSQKPPFNKMTMDLIDMDPWGPVTSALLSSYIIDSLWDHDHCLRGLSSCTHVFSSLLFDSFLIY